MAAPTPKPDYPVRPHQISPEAPLAERLVPTPEAIAAMEERQQASALDRRRDTRAEGIIARRVALSLGLVRYQGRPCRYGHDGVRYASSAGCVTAGRQLLRDLQRRLLVRKEELRRTVDTSEALARTAGECGGRVGPLRDEPGEAI
jgi:hypothetical protein